MRASGAIVLACLALAASSMGQHRASHKLRATALVELTSDAKGNVAAHVVPITILANGNFRDASIYESRPRPMALDNGVVYEVQKTGVPVGYVTITHGSNTPQGWTALGKWQTVTEIERRAKPKPKPASTTAPLDDRPILHREDQTVPPKPTPTPDQSQTSSGDDSDRPILHRPDSNGSDQKSSGSSTQPATPSASPTPTPPEAEPAPVEDPNRPKLMRRKPGDESNSSATPVAPKAPLPAPPKQPATTPPPEIGSGTHTFLAVSDADFTDTRSFEYQWKPEEKTQIEEKMRKLALAQLPGGTAENANALTNVAVRSFDLDLSNDAVVVITADAPGGALVPKGRSGRAAAIQGGPGKPVTRYVAVIARVDIDGNPQKLAASVTDSSRLDVAPRLELIDAVDVDGDGVAELAFREYDFDQKTFIVYGVGHGTVTKVFEGASEPIK